MPARLGKRFACILTLVTALCFPRITIGQEPAVSPVGPAKKEQASLRAELGEPRPLEEYDPWEPFNERMFWFNHDILDRYVLKPAATAWNKLLPETVQDHLKNAFVNLDTPARLANNLLQARFYGAGREVGRFVVNSVIGVGGLFDAGNALGIEKSDADTGQTFGVWGFGPGPYLVLPFLPPLTVRDGIGYGADGALDPWGYVFPFGASLGRKFGNIVNDRSRNLETYADVEESALDLYSAVRNFYLQRRQRSIQDAKAAR